MPTDLGRTIDDLQGYLDNPDDKFFVLHTPLGALKLGKIHSRFETEYVFFNCIDEQDEHRFVGFSASQIATFPLEVTLKTGKRGDIGFMSTSERQSLLNL